MLRNILLSTAALSTLYLSSKNKAECCGIIGILSNSRSNISDSLSLGVQLLKNRGYDSAGIVTFHTQQENTHHQMIKQAEESAEMVNCIERLVSEVSKNIFKAHIGIGHTRWATCGQKVVRNAHPHFDNQENIFIVHNGIISSHAQIKKKHLDEVQFHSETDTEVIVQLLSKFKKEGKTMMEAIRNVEEIIKGTSEKSQWGIVIMDKTEPNKMWTSTNGSPILVGMNDTEVFVASESIAFKKDADCYFVTQDGEVLELEINKIAELKESMINSKRLINISKEEKKDVQKNPPEGYKSFYSYELRQQGSIVFKPDFDHVKGTVPFGPFLSFIACGSSFHAALAANHFFKKLKTFKKINIYDPAELTEGDIVDHETVVLISQSGETKDLINVIDGCKSIEGVKTIGIINMEGSTIARKVDFPIYIKVGRETSVAATKSMFHQTLNLIMLATQIAEKKQSTKLEIIKEIREELLQVPMFVNKTIEDVEEDCSNLAKVLYTKESIYILAMRECLAIAKEAALKIKQLNYIHAEALGSCEMKHGPLALIESGKFQQTAVILFVFDNETYEQCMNAVDQMTSRNALVIIVTDCKKKIMAYYQKKAKEDEKKEKEKTQKEEDKKESKRKQCPEKDYIFITVPPLKHCSHILSLIPLQILVEKISELKNINPDMPRNLAKTVTV